MKKRLGGEENGSQKTEVRGAQGKRLARGGVRVRFPSKIEYCTDNASMIAAAGYFRWHKNPDAYKEWQNIEASTRFGF